MVLKPKFGGKNNQNEYLSTHKQSNVELSVSLGEFSLQINNFYKIIGPLIR